MLCLGSKEGCSFYTYSLHILDQHIRLKYQLPVVFMLQSLVLVKFPVVLQLFNMLKHSLPTVDCQQKWQGTCSKFLKFKILHLSLAQKGSNHV